MICHEVLLQKDCVTSCVQQFSLYCVPFGEKGRTELNLFEVCDSLGGQNDRQNVFLMLITESLETQIYCTDIVSQEAKDMYNI